MYVILFLLVFPAAHAAGCKVFGISDSPQKLHCRFKKFDLALACKNGNYFLNASKVSVAFHMEVEEGAVPLVFRAPGMELTVVINSPRHIDAELNKAGDTMTGSCRQ